MAWEILTPSPGARGGSKHERVTIAYRRHSGGTAHALAITASGPMAAKLGWKPRDRVAVQIDRAARRLRLTKSTDKEGWTLSGKGDAGMTCAYLRWDGLPEGETYPAAPAECSIEGGALILHIPDWAFPDQAPAPAPVVTQAPAPPPPAVRPTAPPAKPTAEQEKAEAIGMLEAGLSAREVSDDTGLPLGTVATWAAEVRARRQRAA
jgi:hypothetical protein